MTDDQQKIKVLIADDHVLLRNALASLIDRFLTCRVVFEAGNGLEVMKCLKSGNIPDIILLDLNMPEMDGFETAEQLQLQYPDIKVMAVTMYDSELSLIRLLQFSVKGFLRKDIQPAELKTAIETLHKEGYYHSNYLGSKLSGLFIKVKENKRKIDEALLQEEELIFLKHAATDKTYKEIAMTMALSPRAIDRLRDQLFVKLDVKSRVGLAIYAVKNGIIRF
ncbi:MAG: response regulator transcription factor [Chitinophagaceae bacterium]|jgi:two-component system, NarL family, invasion response regulator UvrY|nr:response regulator transcription factor [Chitinophagaceae bacterium]